MIRDKLQLMRAFYRAAYLQLTKSPANLWMASLLQLVYYFVQLTFWLGIKATAAGDLFISKHELVGFLVTLAAVDNLYLFFLGPGSSYLENRIVSQNLEPILFWPRAPLSVLVFSTPNFSQLLNALFAIAVLAGYYMIYHVGLISIITHLTSIIIGIFLLNGISFLFRMTTFWTSSIVQVRNSNPSFKIIVRPWNSFHDVVRIILMTLFPALYITAVPAEMLSGKLPLWWVSISSMALLIVWGYVILMWNRGIRRYGIKVT